MNIIIFEPLKAHTYVPNISLIRLMLIMQSPNYLITSYISLCHSMNRDVCDHSSCLQWIVSFKFAK